MVEDNSNITLEIIQSKSTRTQIHPNLSKKIFFKILKVLMSILHNILKIFEERITLKGDQKLRNVILKFQFLIV